MSGMSRADEACETSGAVPAAIGLEDWLCARKTKARRKEILAVLITLVAAILIGMQVVRVNAEALHFPEIHHPIGEWVEIDGSFATDSMMENTTGYAIRVSDAQILSRNEYITLYGEDPSAVSVDPGDDVRNYLCLTLDMRNVGNEHGGLNIQQAKLVPRGVAHAYRPDTSLWGMSNKNMDGPLSVIGLIADTEFSLYIPYRDQDMNLPIKEGRFQFIVTNMPVRHVIDIEASEL